MHQYIYRYILYTYISVYNVYKNKPNMCTLLFREQTKEGLCRLHFFVCFSSTFLCSPYLFFWKSADGFVVNYWRRSEKMGKKNLKTNIPVVKLTKLLYFFTPISFKLQKKVVLALTTFYHNLTILFMHNPCFQGGKRGKPRPVL